MPIDSHLPQADPFSLVPTFNSKKNEGRKPDKNSSLRRLELKVPKCEIFHLFDFNEFYGVKSL
jgi:hypothetical protein